MNDFFYKNLDAYKVAKEFTTYIYSLLKNYPAYEQYAICDQLRRAAVSVPSNIAEGMGRMAIKERLHFLDISNGSQTLGYISEEEIKKAEDIATHLSKVMSGLRKYLSEKDSPQD